MAYTRRLRPRGVPFFRPQVCERAGKSVISVVERPEKVYRKISCEQLENISWFCDLFIINFIYETVNLNHLKGMHRSKLGIRERGSFCQWKV